MVPHDQLPDWYGAADLTVLSSHSEGIPNVLRESLACGTPYVATRVGGVAELSEDPAVRLVPPGDPAALAGAIRASLAERHPLQKAHYGTWRDYAEAVLKLLFSGAPGGGEWGRAEIRSK
jgi:glycosyltransferase involved in cell wall biosynthesis